MIERWALGDDAVWTGVSPIPLVGGARLCALPSSDQVPRIGIVFGLDQPMDLAVASGERNTKSEIRDWEYGIAI